MSPEILQQRQGPQPGGEELLRTLQRLTADASETRATIEQSVARLPALELREKQAAEIQEQISKILRGRQTGDPAALAQEVQELSDRLTALQNAVNIQVLRDALRPPVAEYRGFRTRLVEVQNSGIVASLPATDELRTAFDRLNADADAFDAAAGRSNQPDTAGLRLLIERHRGLLAACEERQALEKSLRDALQTQCDRIAIAVAAIPVGRRGEAAIGQLLKSVTEITNARHGGANTLAQVTDLNNRAGTVLSQLYATGAVEWRTTLTGSAAVNRFQSVVKGVRQGNAPLPEEVQKLLAVGEEMVKGNLGGPETLQALTQTLLSHPELSAEQRVSLDRLRTGPEQRQERLRELLGMRERLRKARYSISGPQTQDILVRCDRADEHVAVLLRSVAPELTQEFNQEVRNVLRDASTVALRQLVAELDQQGTVAQNIEVRPCVNPPFIEEVSRVEAQPTLITPEGTYVRYRSAGRFLADPMAFGNAVFYRNLHNFLRFANVQEDIRFSLLREASHAVDARLDQVVRDADALREFGDTDAYRTLRARCADQRRVLAELQSSSDAGGAFVEGINESSARVNAREYVLHGGKSVDELMDWMLNVSTRWNTDTSAGPIDRNLQSPARRAALQLMLAGAQQGLVQLMSQRKAEARTPAEQTAYRNDCLRIGLFLRGSETPTRGFVDGGGGPSRFQRNPEASRKLPAEFCDTGACEFFAKEAVGYDDLAWRFAVRNMDAANVERNPLLREKERLAGIVDGLLERQPPALRDHPQVRQMLETANAEPNGVQDLVSQFVVMRQLQWMLSGQGQPQPNYDLELRPFQEYLASLTQAFDKSLRSLPWGVPDRSGVWSGLESSTGIGYENDTQAQALELLADQRGYINFSVQSRNRARAIAEVVTVVAVGIAVGLATGGLGIIAAAAIEGVVITGATALITRTGFDSRQAFAKEVASNVLSSAAGRALHAGTSALQTRAAGLPGSSDVFARIIRGEAHIPQLTLLSGTNRVAGTLATATATPLVNLGIQGALQGQLHLEEFPQQLLVSLGFAGIAIGGQLRQAYFSPRAQTIAAEAEAHMQILLSRGLRDTDIIALRGSANPTAYLASRGITGAAQNDILSTLQSLRTLSRAWQSESTQMVSSIRPGGETPRIGLSTPENQIQGAFDDLLAFNTTAFRRSTLLTEAEVCSRLGLGRTSLTVDERRAILMAHDIPLGTSPEEVRAALRQKITLLDPYFTLEQRGVLMGGPDTARAGLALCGRPAAAPSVQTAIIPSFIRPDGTAVPFRRPNAQEVAPGGLNQDVLFVTSNGEPRRAQVQRLPNGDYRVQQFSNGQPTGPVQTIPAADVLVSDLIGGQRYMTRPVTQLQDYIPMASPVQSTIIPSHVRPDGTAVPFRRPNAQEVAPGGLNQDVLFVTSNGEPRRAQVQRLLNGDYRVQQFSNGQPTGPVQTIPAADVLVSDLIGGQRYMTRPTTQPTVYNARPVPPPQPSARPPAPQPQPARLSVSSSAPEAPSAPDLLEYTLDQPLTITGINGDTMQMRPGPFQSYYMPGPDPTVHDGHHTVVSGGRQIVVDQETFSNMQSFSRMDPSMFEFELFPSQGGTNTVPQAISPPVSPTAVPATNPAQALPAPSPSPPSQPSVRRSATIQPEPPPPLSSAAPNASPSAAPTSRIRPEAGLPVTFNGNRYNLRQRIDDDTWYLQAVEIGVNIPCPVDRNGFVSLPIVPVQPSVAAATARPVPQPNIPMTRPVPAPTASPQSPVLSSAPTPRIQAENNLPVTLNGNRYILRQGNDGEWYLGAQDPGSRNIPCQLGPDGFVTPVQPSVAAATARTVPAPTPPPLRPPNPARVPPSGTAALPTWAAEATSPQARPSPVPTSPPPNAAIPAWVTDAVPPATTAPPVPRPSAERPAAAPLRDASPTYAVTLTRQTYRDVDGDERVIVAGQYSAEAVPGTQGVVRITSENGFSHILPSLQARAILPQGWDAAANMRSRPVGQTRPPEAGTLSQTRDQFQNFRLLESMATTDYPGLRQQLQSIPYAELLAHPELYDRQVAALERAYRSRPTPLPRPSFTPDNPSLFSTQLERYCDLGRMPQCTRNARAVATVGTDHYAYYGQGTNWNRNPPTVVYLSPRLEALAETVRILDGCMQGLNGEFKIHGESIRSLALRESVPSNSIVVYLNGNDPAQLTQFLRRLQTSSAELLPLMQPPPLRTPVMSAEIPLAPGVSFVERSNNLSWHGALAQQGQMWENTDAYVQLRRQCIRENRTPTTEELARVFRVANGARSSTMPGLRSGELPMGQ